MAFLRKKKKTEKEKLEEEFRKNLLKLKARDVRRIFSKFKATEKGIELEASKINAKFSIPDAPILVKTSWGPMVNGD